MPNSKIQEYIQRIQQIFKKDITVPFYLNKKLLSYFVTSLVSVLVVLVLAASVVWFYRGEIFGYFAKEYLSDAQDVSISGEVQSSDITEKIIERQSILNQESLVVNTVKRVNPAVVSIVISKEVPKYETYNSPNQNYNPFGNLFPGFNFNIPQYRQNGTEKKEIGGGSGFFVTSEGLIVTNRHVVDQKDVEYTVFTNDGKKHTASVVARDGVLDIALLRIEGTGYPYLTLGNSDTLQVGQSVIAIGNALAEFRNTVSVGVVSGLARSVTAGDSTGKTELLDQVIQTDAAINPGNSGGPLLDLSGRVIGVNVAVAQGSQNVGFALPINSVKGAIESVKSTGKIVRPYIGIRYVAINEQIKERNNLSVDYGLLVKNGATIEELAVIPGSPADKAGIVENDIILEVDGKKIDTDTNLSSLIRQKKVGDIVVFKILHRGVQKTVQVKLEAVKE